MLQGLWLVAGNSHALQLNIVEYTNIRCLLWNCFWTLKMFNKRTVILAQLVISQIGTDLQVHCGFVISTLPGFHVCCYDILQKTLLGELVYMADNVAFFPYSVSDEPLYIIHSIDIIVSVAGSNILQTFREVSCLCSSIWPKHKAVCSLIMPKLVPGFNLKRCSLHVQISFIVTHICG